MIDLVALSPEELRTLMEQWGEKRFRAKQINTWLYDRAEADIDAWTDLPKHLRERLAEACTVGDLGIAAEQVSTDGTVKRLYRLGDGQHIETVLMPYADGRRTVCLSSQVGCAMGCVFCATGQMGFGRNLTAGEIFAQAWRAHVDCAGKEERLSNVVLMGMGEPFHNYDNVLEAVQRIRSQLGIGQRHITISTVGLVPQIRRFAEEGLQVGLAVSLHESTDEARSSLMPVNKRWPLDELLKACREYVEASGRRITFEWALIEGTNDTIEVAKALGKRLRGLHCHINLIPLNPTGGYSGKPSDSDRVGAFVDTLARFGVPATVRMRRGIDIDAGCGQLSIKTEPR